MEISNIAQICFIESLIQNSIMDSQLQMEALSPLLTSLMPKFQVPLSTIIKLKNREELFSLVALIMEKKRNRAL